jgi:hypothetical protein
MSKSKFTHLIAKMQRDQIRTFLPVAVLLVVTLFLLSFAKGASERPSRSVAGKVLGFRCNS